MRFSHRQLKSWQKTKSGHYKSEQVNNTGRKNGMDNCIDPRDGVLTKPRLPAMSSGRCHKLGQVCVEASTNHNIVRIKSRVEQCAASTTAPSILRRSWCWRPHSTKPG